MKQKCTDKAIANKIKKWLQVVSQLNNGDFIFAIPTTRLTSLKSLIQDKTAAELFAFHLAKKLQQEMNEVQRYKEFTQEEWSIRLNLISDTVAQMEDYLADPTAEKKHSFWELLRRIDGLQSNHYGRVNWSTVSFFRSGYLLKLDYALRCFVEQDFSSWAYKLAMVYVVRYEPSYGSGLIPASVPMLLEVSEFWCNYYFDCSLIEKFPQDLKISCLK
ncbi:MAG: hypothetical protein MK289_14030 [Trichodesmium sp. ALOHA_ZT_67]|nr:hypothetical protein [Trichodesmium sp. ALOHA_ZT_67]MDT9339114.1 hypothetical protein [Trichodesmium erythraeum 21-75]